MAEGVAAYERTNPHPRHCRGECCDHRPGLVYRAAHIGGVRQEVVREPDAIPADRFGVAAFVEDVSPGAGRFDRDRKTHQTVPSEWSTCRGTPAPRILNWVFSRGTAGRRCDPAYRSGGVPSSLQADPATKVAGSCSKVRLSGLLVSIPAGECRNRRRPVLSYEPAVSTAGRSPGVLNPPGDRVTGRIRAPHKTLMRNRQAHRRSALYRARRAYAG